MKRSNDKDYKRLAKMLAKWRKKTSTLLYRMGKEEGVRWDYLQRVEEAKGVTAVTLLAYLHYCHRHGYDPLSDLWHDDEPTTTVDSPTSKTVDGSADGSVDDVNDDVVETPVLTPDSVTEEEEKEEHKDEYSAPDSTHAQSSETTSNSDIKSPETDESQYNRLYHDNTSDNAPVETSDGTSDNTITSASNGVENKTGQVAVSDSAKDTEVSLTGVVEGTNNMMKEDCEIMSEQQEKEQEEYYDTLYKLECQDPLNAKLQRLLISVGHTCPNCGGPLVIRENKKKKTKFIGCKNWLPEKKGCNYTANGDFENPILNDDFLPDLIPNPKLNPSSQK